MVRTLSFLISLILMFACKTPPPESIPADFDWQGHRGARGLLPENTIPAMLKALEYDVKTLELDVVISKDSQVVLSHEPWMSAEICRKADGSAVGKSEAKDLKLYEMTYAEIQAYDCGSRGNSGFSEQVGQKTTKVRLADMVQAVEAEAQRMGKVAPYYNIEIKSREEWDNIFTPEPNEFAALVLAEIEQLGIVERTCVQSFDVRSLKAVQEQMPNITKALLIMNQKGVDKNLEILGFTPDIYSPYHLLLSKSTVEDLHAKGMKVIPWTVNKVNRMRALIAMGVDGIITDYPNRISEVTAKE